MPRKAVICKRGHPLTPENRAKHGECLACHRVRNGREVDAGTVWTLCRAGLHDLADPAVARFSGGGRYCGPCAEAATVAKWGQKTKPRPSRAKERVPRGPMFGPPKRYARPRLCRNGHDLLVVGKLGKKCNVCRVAPRRCRAGHLITGPAVRPRSGCVVCDRERKRNREHTKRARHYGSVVLNTKATGWRTLIEGRMCAYCDLCPAESLDHVSPLKRGGAHADWNLVPACKGCNSSKGGRRLSEWKGRWCPGCGMPTGLLRESLMEATYSP